MTAFIFHLIPHTHWDREWYLPRAAFQARLVRMLDDLLPRLHSDAALRSFLLDGQTVLIEDYLRLRPEREADVKALVKSGRLQIGPWYVLADEQIPSGESLIRNLLLGCGDAERLGNRLDVLYSPDAFGHPAALPTIAREFGIAWGVVWRGLATERDRVRWRGLGGKDITVWHHPPDGYEIGAALPGAGAQLPDRWAQVRATLIGRASGKHIPVFVGADHHAAHPTLARLRDLLADLEPESAFRVSRLDEFFQVADDVPARPVTGELRWSYGYTWTLQGTHGTRAPLKRRHGVVELALERIAEPLAALLRRSPGPGPARDWRAVLDAAWRALVRTQFHDTICGTTIDAVAQAADRRLTDVAAFTNEIARGALRDLVGHDPDAARERTTAGAPALVLWNPAARSRAGVMLADLTFFRRDVLVGPPGGREPRRGAGLTAFALRAPAGAVVPVQVVARRVVDERIDAMRHYPDQDEVDEVRVAFRMPAVPGLGITALTLGTPAPLAPRKGEDVRLTGGRTLQNRLVEVTLEATGALTILDRKRDQRYSRLLLLEDEGDAGDTYTYAPVRSRRLTRSHGPVAVRRIAAGPLVAALEARWAVTGGIDARMLVQLYADSPLVRITWDIDNQKRDHRLRARIPTSLAGVAAHAGTAFGSIERAAVEIDPRAFPQETPASTAPAQRWVAVARDTRGLALLAPAFFEYELTREGDLLLTLLRAIGALSRADLPTRPGNAAWPTPIPDAQCIGRSRLEVALAPVSAADCERGDALPALWEDAFLPVQGIWLRDAVAVHAPAAVDATLEGTGLVFSSAKPAQAGSPIVLRCYNATGRKVNGAWRFGDGVKTAHRVRADEREAVALVLEERGKIVRFVAEPHDIVSILIT